MPEVVTQDNFQAYVDARTPAPAEPETVEAETPAPEADAPEQVEETSGDAESKEPEAEKPKGNTKLERRFSELTAQREEARREADRLRAELESIKQPKAAPEPNERPQRAQFVSDDDYVEALAEYKAEQAIEKRELEQQQAAERQKQAEVAKNWQQKQAKAIEALPDYEEVLASSDLEVPGYVQQAILESDIGPQIAYFLAKPENAEVADKIRNASITTALRELGKIEAKLTEEPKKAAPAQKSSAPEPIKPIKATSSPSEKDPDKMTYSQWKAYRAKGGM